MEIEKTTKGFRKENNGYTDNKGVFKKTFPFKKVDIGISTSYPHRYAITYDALFTQ